MSEMKTQKERLLEFIKYLNLSVNGFEKQAGFSTGNIPHMGASIPTKAQQKILTAFPELNSVWLLTGYGNMLNTAEERAEEPTHSTNDTNIDLRAKLAMREQECRLMQSNIDALREIIQAQKMIIQSLSDQIQILKQH